MATASDPAQKGSSISVHRDLGLTGALFAGTRAMVCSRPSWYSTFYWYQATLFFGASSKSSRSSATNGRLSTSLNKSSRTSPPIL